MKKLTAILLAALMLIGCLSTVAVSAAEESATAKLTINGKTYTAAVGAEFTYVVNLKTQHKINNGEFYLGYPQSILTIKSSSVDFPVIGKTNVTYNFSENVQDELRFNFSNQATPYDFTKGGVLVTLSFKVSAAGTGSIGFINEPDVTLPGGLIRESTMSWIDTNNGYVINDELPNAVFTVSVSGITPDIPDPVTKISVKAKSAKIYVNAKTTVTATVTNPVGKTSFTSSNTKAVTLKVSGNVATITAKAAGTTTITAKNNGKSASVKITVVKRVNTMTVKGSTKKVKLGVIKKNALTVSAITVKSPKGTVKYVKKSGSGRITLNKKNGKLTLKKGTKKGTYKFTVNVTAAGTSVYNKMTKSAVVKFVVR